MSDIILQVCDSLFYVFKVVIKVELTQGQDSPLVVFQLLFFSKPLLHDLPIHVAHPRELQNRSQRSNMLTQSLLIFYSHLLIFLVLYNLADQRLHNGILLL